MPKTYSILTYGCQMNVHESEKLAGILQSKGYRASKDKETADIYVLNTCCIRESAETRVLGNLGALKKIKERCPETKIAVCGCMPQAQGAAERLQKRCPFIDCIFGTHNIHKFSEYLELIGGEGPRQTYVDIWDKETDIVEDVPVLRTSGVNAWVNVMYGCNNFCSYCIVPYVRGRERSRAPDRILSDVQELVSAGYKEITLLGQNVNSYGNDRADGAVTFAALLKKIAALRGKFRVKFMTSHPKDLSEEVIRTIADSENLAHFVHLPVQSGSDRILKDMNRNYTAADYRKKIDMIRRFLPDAGISGDMMVGFPGESERDADDTLALMDDVRYDNLYTFIYSPRQGTPAASRSDQIDEAVKKRRIQRLIDRQFTIATQKAADEIGKTYEVLCCDWSDGLAVGKTGSDKTIYFLSESDSVGKFIPVTVEKHVKTKLYAKKKE